MFLLPSGTVLRGGYAGLAAADADARDVSLYPTVLKPVEGDSVLPKYVIAARETGPGTTLDGVIVSEGDVGMEIVDANVVILNCGFEGNDEYGIFCWLHGSNISLSDCYFAHHAECAADVFSSQATFSNCLFEHNQGHLACAIESMGGTLVAVDCTFRANEGGVVYGFGTADLLRCEFVDNSIGGDEALDWSGTATVRQCRFESNTGGEIGAALRLSGDATVADCEFTGNAGSPKVRTSGNVATVTRCSFVGNTNEGGSSRLIESRAALTRISHCLFTGNSGGPFTSGTIQGIRIGATLEVSNCTFADNRAQSNAIGGYWENVSLTQCILQDVPNLFDDSLPYPENIAVTYSNIEGGYPGPGNIDVEPEFVRPGYWADPNDLDVEVGSDDPQAVWVMGDYHLQSQAGHWDRDAETWVFDDVTSPCIDAGDPNGFLGQEPFPNGGYVNMGAYGGTQEASRSYLGKPVCENQLAGDINGDCIVDQTDLDILLSHWLMDSTEVANIPPVIRIVSPIDGAELTYPDPIELRVETSDLDGYIWEVSYRLEASTDTGSEGYHVVGDSGFEDWKISLAWSKIHLDAPHTITATAVDNRGVETTSAPITVTFHP
ncbi:MAG: right-handed parallel beta-helix repeat-containing protein [Sedimentisphaerales bacterium]|nr:right-handed parallel beta-helix repeat-containing protein [Sedimentisphaerales bacterium]